MQRKATTLLGYPCDLVRVMGSENYSIADSDVTLKTVVSMMGMNTTIEATRIDTGSVPEDTFLAPTVPPGRAANRQHPAPSDNGDQCHPSTVVSPSMGATSPSSTITPKVALSFSSGSNSI